MIAASYGDGASAAQQAEAEADFARARHRRLMDALAHWLSYTEGWTPREAAALALGVLPNDAHSRRFGEALPGIEPWSSPMRESWEDRMRRDIAELAARFGTIAEFGFMPAAKQLVAIQKHHGPLPWWPVAREDEACAPLLPGAAEASQRPSTSKSELCTVASEIRWDRDDKHKLLHGDGAEGREVFDALRDTNFTGLRHGRDGEGRPHQGKIAKAIRDDLCVFSGIDPDAAEGAKARELVPALRTIQRAVADWLKETKSADAENADASA